MLVHLIMGTLVTVEKFLDVNYFQGNPITPSYTPNEVPNTRKSILLFHF